MAIYQAPWDFPTAEGTGFFDLLFRHWPHYQTITLEISMSYSASEEVEFPAVYEGDPPEIECAATSRTNTASGSISGTITWTRQSESDEMSQQAVGANKFSMGITLEANPSSSPRIDSALIHKVSDFGSFTELTGTWTQTLYGGDACEVTSETTSGAISSFASLGEIAVVESGTAEWFARLLATYVSFSGTTFPITIPSLQESFLDSLTGPPEGAALVFTSSDTSTTGVGGWTGSCSNSITITLST